MIKKEPKNKLSIYLIKKEFNNHKDILKDFNKLNSKKISNVGTFYFSESFKYKPLWIEKFFGKNLDNIEIFNAGLKAVFLVDVKINMNERRIFAIPFGYGWVLLNHGVYKERFGLKVILNIVDPNNLKSIDKKNITSVPKHTTEQISRYGTAADFGIDIEQDLIRSITGRSRDERFGKTVVGKDSLNISAIVNLSNIEDFLKVCYVKYNSNDYKKDFGWIDQIAEIKNPRMEDILNEKLITNINNNHLEKIWMAVPEIIDWADVSGFAYKNNKNKDLKDDINLSEFISSLPENKRSRIDLKILKERNVYCFSASSDEIKYRWRAYNCVYCEVYEKADSKIYLLSNGKWYEVENDFATQVDNDYKQLRNQEVSLNLPNYNHDNENDYNEEVAKKDRNFCCMDRKNIIHGGGYSRIEFCDLFTKNKEIIHIKRYGGSSVLSHLFQQGIVSGELFLADEDFRAKVNEKLLNSHKIGNPLEKPIPADYKIIFAIISSFPEELDIPFFSKVGLRNTRRRLETYGYKVFLKKINFESKN